METDPDTARLAVSRHAARLFLEKGVSGTNGEDIAAAAGISKRTVWRYFRNKENCVAPLFEKSSLQFTAQLQDWPANLSIEEHLSQCLAIETQSAQDIEDGILVVRLVAALGDEPDLKAEWLMASSAGEAGLAEVIATRLERSARDFDVRLCAALVSAAIRMIDEAISMAAIRHGQIFDTAEVVARLAGTMRRASILNFCDPVIPNIFGDA
ncbi:MAG TPA: TetR family transcriptional regulator [Pelagibacterium sp.]|uniref:TetR/AcrR family transcriptional regulator n=1 Tax=uncultured Pelagibacterium sp. TaxID=1159875 RepID=UPI000C5DB8F3|nr:TetR family transcriptional regulator [Pelagibacterium sp.]HCO53658.1 TetR family transcriptional regulator [Pelagibacterium sp.]|tara:strand:+ start:2069 stop:2701 length:633 start_codon:yes stop_codon:yes gene_type:complete